MIAIQKIGKSFMGALNYNLRKMYLPDKMCRAELLASNFMSLDRLVIQKEIELVKSLRPNLNRYVYHTSLNFPNEDQSQLSNDKILNIAMDYLEQNGFTNNQYFIFRHHDAEHPHIHLLVNRISFDGTVVSDSNNYKKSEAILRKLEYQYSLIPVEQSSYRVLDRNNNRSLNPNTNRSADLGNKISADRYSDITPGRHNKAIEDRNSNIKTDRYNSVSLERHSHITDRAPKKNEIEMVLRTGKPSAKMVLQEKLKGILFIPDQNLSDFISKCESEGISLLFNLASTGRVSGITYFYDGLKAKGQALGNRFKWMEVVKQLHYEQIRDSETISQANGRTRTKYEKLITARQGTGQSGPRADKLLTSSEKDPGINRREQAGFGENRSEDKSGTEGTLETAADVNHIHDHSNDRSNDRVDGNIAIQISDDIDDEAILNRNRHRKQMARTNRR